MSPHKVAVTVPVSPGLVAEAQAMRDIYARAQEDMMLTLSGKPRLGPPEPVAVWVVPNDPPEGLSADAEPPLWRALADLAGRSVVPCDPWDEEDYAASEAAAAIGHQEWRPFGEVR